MVGPKMQDFCLRINMLKGIFFLNPTMTDGSSKSAEIVLLESIIYVKNQRNFFKKKIHNLKKKKNHLRISI